MESNNLCMAMMYAGESVNDDILAFRTLFTQATARFEVGISFKINVFALYADATSTRFSRE
jgi:hypothetical protein